ncbi:MAG: hypothetical protein PHV34_12015 [Verrucomicrobiae bacterium]|nr:hypothetical protein [Verrucomicrobiae bacterium]
MNLLFFFLLIPLFSIPGQDAPPPPIGGSFHLAPDPAAIGSQTPAPPVVIRGKPVDQMSDDELRDFLQTKVQTIEQGDQTVEIVRVAPGYPVTIHFAEPMAFFVPPSDPNLFSIEKISGKTLAIAARQRQGDGCLQVYFGGGKIRLYHVFTAENLVQAHTALRVASFETGSGLSSPAAPTGVNPHNGTPDVRAIANIIGNFDALMAEKAITPREVRRFPVFRKNPKTSFTCFDLYRFADGPLAVSFAYANPFTHAIRLDESRMRISLGNLQYVPDYVSLHRRTLEPGANTTGFAVVNRPAFHFDQPFELIWK